MPRITFFKTGDGYRFAARVWDSPRPRARVVFLHGIISHGGWYGQSCRWLAEAGVDVHFLDRRGSGLNDLARGDVDRWETWLTDVESYLDSLPSDVPRVLIGISWGGKLATSVAKRRPDLLAGLGLLGPGLFAKRGATALQRAALQLAAATGVTSLRVTIPLQEPELFTDSPPWKNYIATDPLTLRKVTVRFALADQAITRFATTDPERIQTPTLLMLAGRDRIIDNPRVKSLVERMGTTRKRIIEYPGATHTFEFEPDPSAFLRDLREFVESCD